MHLIARHTVELEVATEAAAAELYAEVSAVHGPRLTPVIDEALDAVCPSGMTLRIDRIVIDAGHVSREGLADALVAALRDQLPRCLQGTEHRAGKRPGAGPGSSDRLLTEAEVALEQLAIFFEAGAATWRHAREQSLPLEDALVIAIERAPEALRQLLRRMPPGHVARRLWTQFSGALRSRLLASLGVADAETFGRVVTDCVAAALAFHDAASSGAANRPLVARGAVEEAILECAWRLVIAGQTGSMTREALAYGLIAPVMQRLPTRLEPRVQAEEERQHREAAAPAWAAAARAVGAASPVRAVVAALSNLATRRAEQTDSVAEGDDRVVLLPQGAASAAVLQRTDGGHGTPEEKLMFAGGAEGASATSEGTTVTPFPKAAHHAHPAVGAANAARESSTRSTPSSVTTEPLWAAHAGTVIAWPFLPGLFEACGLTTAKRFVDDDARARAVLLTAYLASGLDHWGEHDLLVEKLLCGHPLVDPVPPSISLRAEERREVEDLLSSVVAHWRVLKSTSPDGLRRAFLARAGTATAVASGWKLEVPRAGHDVLLDSLPWGIGLVLLPWMEQPLHVEW